MCDGLDPIRVTLQNGMSVQLWDSRNHSDNRLYITVSNTKGKILAHPWDNPPGVGATFELSGKNLHHVLVVVNSLPKGMTPQWYYETIDNACVREEQSWWKGSTWTGRE